MGYKKSQIRFWPQNYRQNDTAYYGKVVVRIVNNPGIRIPSGHVPFRFLVPKLGIDKIISAPADSLWRCFSGFRVNQEVKFRAQTAFVYPVLSSFDISTLGKTLVPIATFFDPDKRDAASERDVFWVEPEELSCTYSGFEDKEVVIHNAKPATVFAVRSLNLYGEVPILYIEDKDTEDYAIVPAKELIRLRI